MSIVKSKEDCEDQKPKYALSNSKPSAKIVVDVIAHFFSLMQIELNFCENYESGQTASTLFAKDIFRNTLADSKAYILSINI